jgi:hypothetical protein
MKCCIAIFRASFAVLAKTQISEPPKYRNTPEYFFMASHPLSAEDKQESLPQLFSSTAANNLRVKAERSETTVQRSEPRLAGEALSLANFGRYT